MQIARKTVSLLAEHLNEAPVTWIRGARQIGKSTLAQSITNDDRPYLTLDDASLYKLAKNDPQGFIQGLPNRVVIDEIQLVPELFRAIKFAVDRDRTPGRFLLTGSTNVFALAKASESLAGRMQILDLEPLSQVEIEAGTGRFIDRCFAQEWKMGDSFSTALTREMLWERVCTGGYPEAVKAKSSKTRDRLFSAYLKTILERDVKEITEITRFKQLPQLLRILASRSSQILNRSDVGRVLAIPRTTLDRYFALLEAVFLHKPIEAYHADAAIALAKADKIQLLDTGLAAHLLELDKSDWTSDLYGHLVESFICNEVRRLCTWQDRKPALSHFRDKGGREVDIVLDGGRRRGVIGIEVKAKYGLSPKDFRGLQQLKKVAKAEWNTGIVLYQGESIIKHEDNWAIPIQALWEW